MRLKTMGLDRGTPEHVLEDKSLRPPGPGRN